MNLPICSYRYEHNRLKLHRTFDFRKLRLKLKLILEVLGNQPQKFCCLECKETTIDRSLQLSIMNFKSLLLVGFSFATLSLALPAHADDTATVVNNNQSTIVTGNGNTTNQSNFTSVRNSQSGRRTSNNTGNVVTSNQAIDVAGNNNTTNQSNTTSIRNYQHRSR
jgi:hypothetical protein